MEVAWTLNRLVNIIQRSQAEESQGLKIQSIQRSFPFQCIVESIHIHLNPHLSISIFNVTLEFKNHDTCYIKSFRSKGHDFIGGSEGSVNPLTVDCFEVKSTTKVKEKVFDVTNERYFSILKDRDVYTKVSESEKIKRILESDITQDAIVLNNDYLYLKTNINGDRVTLKNPESDWMNYLRSIVLNDNAPFGSTYD